MCWTKGGEMFVQERQQSMSLRGSEKIIPVELLLHEPAQLDSIHLAPRNQEDQLILSNHLSSSLRSLRNLCVLCVKPIFTQSAQRLRRDRRGNLSRPRLRVKSALLKQSLMAA